MTYKLIKKNSVQAIKESAFDIWNRIVSKIKEMLIDFLWTIQMAINGRSTEICSKNIAFNSNSNSNEIFIENRRS